MSIVVEDYNPEWANHFQTIRAELEGYLEDVPIQGIEHAGSTSVPGLAAKPIIDIDIIVEREGVQPVVDKLVKNGGFTYMGELGIKDRHALRDSNQNPARNIYVCVAGAFQLRNHLAVRDTLRRDSDLRDQYGRVKMDLAAQALDIVGYGQGKSGILQNIMKAAGILNEDELKTILSVNTNSERFSAIKTERLTIREFVVADVDAYFKLESIPEVVRYQTYEPLSRKECCDRVVAAFQKSTTVPRSYVELAVLQEGQFIGRIGAIKKDVCRWDLFYSFMPEVHGKGLATEAMRAFIPILGSPLELQIECDPRNTGSCKMAERLGFEKFHEAEKVAEYKGEWVDSVVYSKTV